MIGNKWFYVKSTKRSYNDPEPVLAVDYAIVIAETPRKWILREREEVENDRARVHVTAPGASFADWQIFKKGESSREGKGWRGATRVFHTTCEAALGALSAALEARWAHKHAHRIASKVQYLRDSALLRQVADLIDYKEGET
jgi:hypothetical protein